MQEYEVLLGGEAIIITPILSSITTIHQSAILKPHPASKDVACRPRRSLEERFRKRMDVALEQTWLRFDIHMHGLL